MSTELYDLTEQLCQEVIDSAGVARLRQLVLTNTEARLEYVRLMDMHGRLMWSCRAQECPTTESTRHFAARVRVSVSELGAPLLHSFLAPWGALRTACNSSVAVICLVGLLFYGSFGLLVWQLGNQRVATHRPIEIEPSTVDTSSFIATLHEQAGCKWELTGHALRNGDGFAPGQSLRLAAGLAKIRFQNGASIVLEGPAELALEAAQKARLSHGKLTALVPLAAVGFTVATPHASIIDLGTEFGVEVDDRGAAEVQVFQGKVALHTSAPIVSLIGQALANEDRLNAGQAVRITPILADKQVDVQPIPLDGRRFVRSVPSSAPKFLPVAKVTASSELTYSEYAYRRRPIFLIDGSGLNSRGHSNEADWNMWHSTYGDVQGAWVMFDLGSPHELQCMKVWNHNESGRDLYKVRGVAQADIYVSNTGRGTWLTDPAEWTLLASDVALHMADGKPTYNTPDVVSLGNVRAQFVAIAIDDCFGTDPIVPDAKCVGLSEVQFYGNRVSPKTQER